MEAVITLAANVIPAQAGIHLLTFAAPHWIPACAGMTKEGAILS